MNGGFATRAAALLAALAASTALQAQAVKDFQLPPGAPAPVVGPTDSSAPAPQPSSPPVAVPRPAPSPAPTRTASPSPSPSPSPAPRATAPAARPSPTPAATASARPVATPAATTAAVPVASETAPPPEATAPASAAPSESAAPAPAAAAAQDFPGWLLWLAAAAGALLLAYGGYLLGRRSRSSARGLDDAADEAPAYTPPAAPAAEPAPPAAPVAAPRPAPPPPAQGFATRPFEMTLEPQRMTMAMINASMNYRLTIVNRGDEPLGPLRITCDLISAHASLQQAEQLVPDPAQAWLSHDFDALGPGEDLVINGEVKLPRTEILPIRSGNSPLFVPLARFTVQVLENDRPVTVGARVFVIGEEPEQPGAGLKPFRLNDGTRSYSRIGQREVSIAS